MFGILGQKVSNSLDILGLSALSALGLDVNHYPASLILSRY